MAAVASIAALVFSFGGYVVWGVIDFYSPPNKGLFDQLFLLAAILLLHIAGYFMFFALIGHKFVPKAVHIPIMIVSAAIAIPSSYFVSIALF